MINKPEQKILIIDDDDRNIFALKAVLVSRGFQCVIASNGLQALDVLQEQKDIAIALVDMMMPEMDGYELMSVIKRIASLSHIILIAVTAQAMIGDKAKCLAAGADHYISKPINVDSLLDILNEYSKQKKW